MPPLDIGKRALLGLVLFSLPLAQTFVRPGVSVADLALALAAALAAADLMAHRRAPTLAPWALPVAAFVGWSMIAAAGVARQPALPFSAMEFSKSLAKLVFYAGCSLLLADLVHQLGARVWSALLLTSAAVHALLGLYVLAAMQLPWNVPYEFLWSHSQRGGEAAFAATAAGERFVRLRGAAAEPSYIGFFLVMALAVAWALGPPRRAGWREVVICVAIVLSLSLSAFALAAVALPVVLWLRSRQARQMVAILAVAGALLLVLALGVPPMRKAIRSGMVERPLGIAAGTLPRANLMRLHGSYAPAVLMAGESPLFGVGLGNYEGSVGSILPRLDPAYGVGPGSPSWSVPAYLLATLGLPGLALLLVLLGAVARTDWAAGTLLAAAAVADGTFLGAPFWVFLVLLAQGRDRSGAHDGEASALGDDVARVDHELSETVEVGIAER